MKRYKMNRREFIKSSAYVAGSAAGLGVYLADNPELEAAPAPKESEMDSQVLAACPYCGVGCGTIILVKNRKIVSMRPDKDHPAVHKRYDRCGTYLCRSNGG